MVSGSEHLALRVPHRVTLELASHGEVPREASRRRGVAMRLCRTLLSVLAWLAPAVGLAQEGGGRASPEARARFQAGTEAFDVGEYERAAEEFRAAYELTRHPDVLFNIYSALDRAGQLAEAAEALESYLRAGDPLEERRIALRARLARLQARLAESRARAAEARLEAERRRGRRDAQPNLTESAPTRGHGAPDRGVHPVGVAVLAGGGALLSTFAVVAALASVEDSTLSDRCSPGCAAAEVSTLDTLNVVADISWVSGALFAATGMVLLFVVEPESPGDEGELATLRPYVTQRGGGLLAVGRFR